MYKKVIDTILDFVFIYKHNIHQFPKLKIFTNNLWRNFFKRLIKKITNKEIAKPSHFNENFNKKKKKSEYAESQMKILIEKRYLY